MKTKLKQISSLFLSLTSCVLILNSCDTNDPPPGNGNKETITISVEDTSPTEVWLNLTTQNLKLPADLLLLRNGDASNVFSLTQTDTLIYDDSLQPSTTYTYQVSSIKNQVSSNEVTFTTMDTTSHNFTWQTYTFGGEGGSSALYDVAIIDDNNIWAVGEIYTADDKYNAVHWNGSRWELKKFTTTGYISPIYTVFAFNENDIWFNGLVQWDGNTLSVHTENFPLEPNGDGWRINSIWGTSSIDFYVVGNGGNIARFNGSSWQKIESGTDLWINDIYGSTNPSTGETEIICVAANFFEDRGVEVIKIKENNTIEFLNNIGLRFISSTWFKAGIRYYIVGDGLFEKTQKDTIRWIDLNKNRIITQNFMNSIRGNGLNDIMVVGAFGEFLHFNGLTWNSQKDITSVDGSYYKVAVKRRIVVAVGYDQNQGVILFGRHQ